MTKNNKILLRNSNTYKLLKIFMLFLSITIITNQERNKTENLKFLDSSINKSKNSKEIYDLYLDFISVQGKSYTSIEEFNKRFKAFEENLKEIKFNFEDKDLVNDFDANKLPKFIDIAKEEFHKKYLNLKLSKEMKEKIKQKNIKDKEKGKKTRNLFESEKKLPKNFDWRKLGKVSSVKEQGECGVCWAFAAAGNLESLYAIKHNKILDLSEEQMLDCDLVNDGCDGGNMEDAFIYINKAGGLMKEVDYPYTQIKDKCKFVKSKSIIKVQGWEVLDTQDEDEIAKILIDKGPLSTGINGYNLQLHESGIYDENEETCPKDNLNHAVLIVGYGEDKGKKYWIVKNSWGENWADDGFFKIARGKSTCGINQYVVYGKLG